TRRWRSKLNRIPISSAPITKSDDLGKLPLLETINRHEQDQHRSADQERIEQHPRRRGFTVEEDSAVGLEQTGERVETQQAANVVARLRQGNKPGAEEEEHPNEAEQERLQL